MKTKMIELIDGARYENAPMDAVYLLANPERLHELLGSGSIDLGEWEVIRSGELVIGREVLGRFRGVPVLFFPEVDNVEMIQHRTTRWARFGR